VEFFAKVALSSGSIHDYKVTIDLADIKNFGDIVKASNRNSS